MFKKFLFLATLAVVYGGSYGQSTLDDCQRLARENYPAIRRYGLIELSRGYRLSEISKGWIPQASINGKASYQSDVVGISLDMPGINIPKLPKLQYQATVDVTQALWDGGVMRSQRLEADASAKVDNASLEVELYNLRERVNDLYFGILLAREQLNLNKTYIENLEENLAKVSSMATNGAASTSDVNAVEVGIVQARQDQMNILSSLESYQKMLQLMIGCEVGSVESMVQPAVEQVDTATIYRPELNLYDAQNNLVQTKISALNASTMPRFSAFAQGGIGAPGLNMFRGGFGNWAMAGVKLNWNLAAFYGKGDVKKQIKVNQQTIENAREVFLYNINIQKVQQQQAIENYRKTMAVDDQIIDLRQSVEQAACVKMEQGVIGVSDYIRETLATQQARQNKSLRHIQLLMEIYKLKNTLNN